MNILGILYQGLLIRYRCSIKGIYNFGGKGLVVKAFCCFTVIQIRIDPRGNNFHWVDP